MMENMSTSQSNKAIGLGVRIRSYRSLRNPLFQPFTHAILEKFLSEWRVDL